MRGENHYIRHNEGDSCLHLGSENANIFPGFHYKSLGHHIKSAGFEDEMTGITIMIPNALTACVINIIMDKFRASIILLVIQRPILMLGDFSISLHDFQALGLEKKIVSRKEKQSSLCYIAFPCLHSLLKTLKTFL